MGISLGLVCLILMLSIYLFFTGEGRSKDGAKPRKQRKRYHHLTYDSDGVLRDDRVRKQKAEDAAFMKKKEKEDRLRKQNVSFRDWPISEYQALRKEMVYYEAQAPKLKFV